MRYDFRNLLPSAVDRRPSAVIDLILYSNLWIALGAAALCFQTQLLLSGKVQLAPLAAFIFCATLFLYALHRLVGLRKAAKFTTQARHQVMLRFRSHILVYAFAAAVATLWFAWQLPPVFWWWILPGVVLAFGYVLPIFGRGRRLRDFQLLKIFLIAPAWAWITVILPAVELQLHYSIPLVFLFFERLFFLFAVSLPFDIRDMDLDRSHQVRTLPAVLGLGNSKLLAYFSLLSAACCGGFAYRLNVYTSGGFAGLLASLLLTGLVIARARPQWHDYYFSGVVDGMLVLQFVLVYVGMGL